MCKSRSKTMSVSEGLLEPGFCTLRVKKESRSKGNAPVFGGFLRATPLVQDLPQEVREVGCDGRQSEGFRGMIPYG